MHALRWSRDATAGLAAAVLGAVYLAAAFQIEPDPSTTSVVGPRAAPIVIGAAMILCALALLFRGLTAPQVPVGSRSPGAGQGQHSSEAGATSGGLRQRQVLVVFGLLAAYIVAFIPLGYLLSTFVFLVAVTTYVERRRLVRNCIFAAAFAAVVYVLFNYGLKVVLPPGPLG